WMYFTSDGADLTVQMDIAIVRYLILFPQIPYTNVPTRLWFLSLPYRHIAYRPMQRFESVVCLYLVGKIAFCLGCSLCTASTDFVFS
ncbi:hypothetical protein, partial [Acinetobacter baumannii]|uniref:hypothetical protein n=1 Tax=Acinetobacter baumannii TaxID=470 RepID=UPI001404F0C1